MLEQYNKNIRFNDYKKGEEVWMKIKHFKTGETRKLAPRRNGPWIVLRKMPNGVNLEVKNQKNITNKNSPP